MTHTPIHVVSLTSAVDRRAAFAQRAEQAGLDWRFFDAYREPQGLRYDPKAAIREHGRPLHPGELGCYSSHAALWRQLLADPTAEQYLILEDDVIADWAALRLLCATDLAKEGIAYLRLFYKKPSPHLPWRRNWPAPDLYVVRLYGKPYGTQGYFLTKAGAARFLDLYTDAVRPVDDQMDRFWESGIPNLCLFPFPILEEYRASTIGSARFGDAGGSGAGGNGGGAPPRGARVRGIADRLRRKAAFLIDRTLRR